MVMTTRLMSILSELMQAKPRSTFLIPTIYLHQSLPSTTGFMVLLGLWYYWVYSTTRFMVPTNCLYQSLLSTPGFMAPLG
jgi:hypothetical protein